MRERYRFSPAIAGFVAAKARGEAYSGEGGGGCGGVREGVWRR